MNDEFYSLTYRVAKSGCDVTKQVHNIPPVYDEASRILILGSFPSVSSRTSGFYYGHPQNRFWRVLAVLYGEDLPRENEEKRELLIRHNIALWDVVSSCTVSGSADSSISGAIPNDVSAITESCGIERIFTNGKTAQRLYERYIEPKTKVRAYCLPSTSPANAKISLTELTERWSVILS